LALNLALVVSGDASGAKKAAEETRAAVAKIGTAAAGAARQAEAAFAGLEAEMAGSAAQIAAVQGAVGRAASTSAGAAARGVQLTGQQLAGLQFQLQDLGVQLASGQSPFLAIAQQGSQIVQTFGPGTGVLGALRAVGGSIASFVTNPLNLALLGFTALAAGAQLAWNAISGGAEETADALERHEALIGRIRDAWPEAAGAAADYGRESIAVVRAQLEGDTARLAASLKEKLDAVFAEVGTPTFRRGASLPQIVGFDVGEFAPFEAAIARLREGLQAGEPDVKAFRRAVAEIAATQPENAALKALALELLDLTDAALEDAAALSENAASVRGLGAAAAGELARVEAFGDALRSLQGIALPDLSDRERALAGLRGAIDSAEGPQARAAALREYEAALGRVAEAERQAAEARAAREGGRAGGAAAKAVDAERDGVAALIGALSEETLAMQLAGRERAVQAALREAGAAATAKEREEIRQIIEAQYDWQEAQDRAIAGLDRIRGASRGVLGGVVADFRAAAGAAETLLNAANRVFDAFLNRGLDVLNAWAFGGSGTADTGAVGGWFRRFLPFAGGGLVSGLVSGPGGPTDDAIPARLSAGEFVVNARATGRNRGLLEAINAGAPGFAAGGHVGPPRFAAEPGGARPGGAMQGAREVHNTFISIQTPNPKAFAEDRTRVFRGAARLSAEARRHS